MNIFELTDHIHTTEGAIQFLRDRGVLRSLNHPPLCDVCGQAMQEARRKNTRGDSVHWLCRRQFAGRHHKRTQSIRHGSFLKNSNLELKRFILLAYTWAHGFSNRAQETMIGLTDKPVTQWNQWFRNICSQHLLNNNNNPIRLGGVGSSGICGSTVDIHGIRVNMLDSYKDEVQWRQLYGKKTVKAFDNLLHHISIYFPVNN